MAIKRKPTPCPRGKQEFQNVAKYIKHIRECPARWAAYWRVGKSE